MMDVEAFRRAMNEARNQGDGLCYLMHGEQEVIAVGLDSGKGVAILFPGNREVPLVELREGFE